MNKRVLIIGGYGNFGSYVAKMLAKEENLVLIIAGRSLVKAQKLAASLGAANPAEAAGLDILGDLDAAFQTIRPDIVVHTTGPFQYQGYEVISACLKQKCHYIDLADGRLFVAGIAQFDDRAKASDILAVSGASSVPCLTAAVLDAYLPRFSDLNWVDYGITAAQQTNRGLATTSAVLSYVGEPFSTRVEGHDTTIYGWQDLHRHRYPELGWRYFANADIADLEIFPARYPSLKTIRFSAGHEIKILHFSLWLLSWVVRSGVVPPLEHAAKAFLKVSHFFDILGSKRSGFHMVMAGLGTDGQKKAEAFYIIARQGHGAFIPTIPAILLTKGLAAGTITSRGAQPCVGLITLDAYCDAMKDLDLSFLRDVPMPVPVIKKPFQKNGPQKTGGKSIALGGTPLLGKALYSYRDDAAVPKFPDDKPVFVFDGVCGMCSKGVTWVMKGQHAEKFRFATAKSPLGEALYRHYGVSNDESFLLIDAGAAYTKSDGYLHLLDILGGPWVYLRVLREIPQKTRDKLYDTLARNRFKWFGKANHECELVPEEFRKNLLS